jgi:streptogrisin C
LGAFNESEDHMFTSDHRQTSAPRHRAAKRALAAVIAMSALSVPTLAAAHDMQGGTTGPSEPGSHAGEIGDDAPARGTAESETLDIGMIAVHYGWSVAATRRHMADQAAFGALQQKIEAQFANSFAGAEFAPAPGGKSYLRFKGTVPAAVDGMIASSGLNVSATGGRRYSAIELGNRLVAVLRFYGNAGYTTAGGAVLPTGQLQVAVTGQPKPGLQLPASLSDGTTVTFTDQLAGDNDHTYGGAYIHGVDFQCTSGFSVKSLITGELGVTTAAHCEGMYHYHQPQTSPVVAYDMDWQDQHLGLFGDIEWHTTPSHIVVDDYYASPTDKRDVASVEQSAAVNNTYCVYSRMQGIRTCDQVWSTYAAILTTAGLSSDLVGMDNDDTVHGDSGGPWSYGTEAVGTVVGSLWVPFKTHGVFSKAWLFDSALDIEVLTT